MKTTSPTSNVRLRSALKNERDPRKRVCLLLEAAEESSRADYGKSAELCADALKDAKAARMKDLVAASAGMSGKILLMLGDRTSAARSFKQSLNIYRQLGDLDAALEMECGLASAKLSTGSEKDILLQLHRILHERLREGSITKDSDVTLYAKSLITTYTKGKSATKSAIMPSTRKSKKIFIACSWQDRLLNRIPSQSETKRNQQIQLANIYDALGFAYIVIREHHKAASLLEEELAIARHLKDPIRIAHATNNLGYVHAILGTGVLALEYAQKGLKLSRQLGDMRGVAINQRSLAEIYLNSGKPQQGKRLAMQSYQTALNLGMTELACRALVTLTRYERLHGSMANAVKINKTALNLLQDRPTSGPYMFFAFQQLLIEHAKSPSKAVYKKLVHLHKSARERHLEVQHEIAQEIARIAEELQLLPDAVRWFKRVHEHQIERLNSEQRNTVASLQTEQELERAERDRELQKLRMDKLQLQLTAKERETELLAMQLAKKGSALATLTDQLALLKSSNPDVSSKTIDTVVKLIETIRHKDSEYENLESRAEALHHEFIVALSARFPTLTATEKRICILLKLGLNAIDIANILFTSVRTIEAHAFSIRRKLKIPGSVRLSKYLISY